MTIKTTRSAEEAGVKVGKAKKPTKKVLACRAAHLKAHEEALASAKAVEEQDEE